MAGGGGEIVKTALLISFGTPSSASETLTRLLVEGVLGTDQEYVPLFEVLAMMVIQLEPASVEYSNFTFPLKQEEVQVIL
jgi:hypothetical protein